MGNDSGYSSDVEWLSVREYADLYDLTTSTVRSRIRTGRLNAERDETADGKRALQIRVQKSELPQGSLDRLAELRAQDKSSQPQVGNKDWEAQENGYYAKRTFSEIKPVLSIERRKDRQRITSFEHAQGGLQELMRIRAIAEQQRDELGVNDESSDESLAVDELSEMLKQRDLEIQDLKQQIKELQIERQKLQTLLNKEQTRPFKWLRNLFG